MLPTDIWKEVLEKKNLRITGLAIFMSLGGTHHVICISHKFFNMGTTAELVAGRGAKFMVLPPLLNGWINSE